MLRKVTTMSQLSGGAMSVSPGPSVVTVTLPYTSGCDANFCAKLARLAVTNSLSGAAGSCAAYSLPCSASSGASTSVYQPPGPGHTSATVISGLMPKNSSVSSGWRQASRARFSAERCSPASTLPIAAAVASSRGTAGGATGCGGGGAPAQAASNASSVALSRTRNPIDDPTAARKWQRKNNPARGGVRIEGESLVVSPWSRSTAERTTAALAWARRTFLRLVDAQRTAVHLVAVEALDRGLRLARTHFDEAEATGLARFAVVDQLYGIDLAVALEQHLDILLGRGEGQVAHVDRRHPGHLSECGQRQVRGPCMYRGQLKTGQGFKAHVTRSFRSSWGSAACTVVRALFREIPLDASNARHATPRFKKL